MIDGYMQESEIETLDEREKEIELIKNIIYTRKEIKNVDKNFEYAQDDLVDLSNESKSGKIKLFDKNGKNERNHSRYD